MCRSVFPGTARRRANARLASSTLNPFRLASVSSARVSILLAAGISTTGPVTLFPKWDSSRLIMSRHFLHADRHGETELRRTTHRTRYVAAATNGLRAVTKTNSRDY